MSVRLANPRPLRDDLRAKRIRGRFRLDRPPFAGIPDEALLLAFTPAGEQGRCAAPSGAQACDNQAFELYGDTVLAMLIAMVMMDIFGARSTPAFLSRLKAYLVSNRMLTDWMLALGACDLVGRQAYAIADTPKFHNACADAFEALVGTLYMYLTNRYPLVEVAGPANALEEMKRWLVALVGLPHYIQAFVDREGGGWHEIYFPADRPGALARLKAKKEERLRDLELEAGLSAGEAGALRAKIEERFSAAARDFADQGALLVRAGDSLERIFSRLGWREPLFVRTPEGVIVYGYPNLARVIGAGATKEEAARDAVDYLLDTGHIAFYRPPVPVYARV